MVEINIGSEEWLAQVKEDIVEPDIRIIDPHHHLWDDRGSTYLVKDLQADTGSGHNVLKTVYMECGWGYKEDGPRHLKVIGETEAVVDQANKSKETGEAVISAIVSRADLRLGEEVIEVLEAHEEASQGLFRGIRHAGARAEQINQTIEWSTVIQGDDSNELDTFEFLPSLALKYELNEKQNLRFAASKTYTLPQFKERAPFLFQEEINQDTQGNPALENSTNYNVDLRWELFPSSSEILSFAVFGKYIENPINTFLIVSAANNLSYANTGDSATAFGAEIEARVDIFENERETASSMLTDRLSVGGNIAYLNTNQKLDYQKVSEETDFAAEVAATINS